MNPATMEELVVELALDEAEATLMLGALRLLPFAAEQVAAPADLRDRVKRRIAGTKRPPTFIEAGSYFARSSEMGWIAYAEGVEVKLLYSDPGSKAQTVMVRMAPNRPFPPHDHAGDEDLYLIEGDAFVGDVPMRAGDYCRAIEGSSHNDVRSGGLGALAIVVTR